MGLVLLPELQTLSHVIVTPFTVSIKIVGTELPFLYGATRGHEMMFLRDPTELLNLVWIVGEIVIDRGTYSLIAVKMVEYMLPTLGLIANLCFVA